MSHTYLSISTYLGVTPNDFKKLGIFDANLYQDEKLFVDIALLPLCKVAEFEKGVEDIRSYYTKILLTIKQKLNYNENSKDFTTCKNKAINMLIFKELHGVQLGYGENNSHGLGIGRKKAEALEEALTTLIRRKIETQDLFYLFPILSDKPIGADNISDMVIAILSNNIYNYTERMLKELKVKNIQTKQFQNDGKVYNLTPHPKFPKLPLLLLPYNLLSQLPVMDSYDSYIYYDGNQQVKENLEREIIASLPTAEGNKQSASKSDIKEILRGFVKRADIEGITSLITAISKTNPKEYDMSKSFEFLNIIQEIMDSQKINTKTTLKNLIKGILGQFENFINHNTNRILDMFRSSHVRVIEKQVQTLILASIDQICQQHNLDISVEPESNGGKIDIKISQGLEKVIIEVKLSTHKDLVIHYDNQLLAYQTAENNAYGFYVVFDVDNGKKKEIDELKATPKYDDREYIIIDTKRKTPPSKRTDSDTLFDK